MQVIKNKSQLDDMVRFQNLVNLFNLSSWEGYPNFIFWLVNQCLVLFLVKVRITELLLLLLLMPSVSVFIVVLEQAKLLDELTPGVRGQFTVSAWLDT